MLDGVLDDAKLRNAKAEVSRILRTYGIEDAFTVKVKTTKYAHYLAQYRSFSQFRSRPIFWLNPEHPADAEELVRTLLHEYGHVIWELARIRSNDSKTAQALWTRLDDIFFDDEEEFAESFARALTGRSVQPWVAEIMALYLAALTTP